MNPSAPVRSGLELTKLQVNAKAPREAQQATKRILNEGIGENLLTQLTAGAGSKALQLAQPKSPAKVFGPFLRNAKPSGPPDIESWK